MNEPTTDEGIDESGGREMLTIDQIRQREAEARMSPEDLLAFAVKISQFVDNEYPKEKTLHWHRNANTSLLLALNARQAEF